MIIVRGKIVASAEEAKLIVAKTENGFVVRTNGENDAFEFDKTQLEFHPDIAYLTHNIWGESVIFWQSEIGHSRDAYASICFRKKINMMRLQMSHAVFAVGADGVPHALLYGDTYIESTGVSGVEVDENGTETGFEILERLIPEIRPFVHYCRAKTAALSRFNAVDSIAGLENQLDLLTSAVALLMAEVPAENRPAWWGDFASVVEAHSSTNLRGKDNAILNIEIEKSKARDVQNEFFAKLTNG